MLGQFGSNGVAYMDLLLVHFPFTIKPKCRFFKNDPECATAGVVPADKLALQDTWRAMEDLKKMGVVKSIGVSDYNTTQLTQTLEAATMRIEVNKVEWNPKHHSSQMKEFCDAHGIRLQAWSPLGGAGGSVLSEDAMKTL